MQCLICGDFLTMAVEEDPMLWRGQFRILYESPYDLIAVSGVGVYEPHGAGWLPPLHPDTRWHDKKLRRKHARTPGYGYTEFMFHDACWTLLEAVYYPEEVPLEEMLSVCEVLPFPSEGTIIERHSDWDGTELSSLHVVKDQFPWEDRLTGGDVASAAHFVSFYDPYLIPEIKLLPYEMPRVPDTLPIQPVTATANVLTKLPFEIILEIAMKLPTRDALSARQASPAFFPIFYSKKFWKSRFTPEGERSWLPESENWAKSCDWRYLYHRTNKIHRTPHVNNRKRVWELAQRIQRYQEQATSAEPIPFETTSLTWEAAPTTASHLAALEERYYPLELPQLHRQRPTMLCPDDLLQIGLSTVSRGTDTYISGLRLLYRGHKVKQLGHVTKDEVILDANHMVGFELAVGLHGIRGIRCVHNKGRFSQWIGAQDAPRTRRLIFPDHIMAVRRFPNQVMAIKAEFDGWKMVGLEAAACSPVIEPTTTSLRDSAYWYPEYPHGSLCLNEQSFVLRTRAATEYKPLCCTNFGGPGGVYLPYLTGVTVITQRTLFGIEFHYSKEDIPAESRKVGAWSSAPSSAHVIRFPIDGAGGEVITSITPYMWYYTEVEQMDERGTCGSIEFATNRGNRHHFNPRSIRTTHALTAGRPIVVKPGSTITGLYWHQAYWPPGSDCCIDAIGAISEHLPPGPWASRRQY